MTSRKITVVSCAYVNDRTVIFVWKPVLSLDSYQTNMSYLPADPNAHTVFIAEDEEEGLLVTDHRWARWLSHSVCIYFQGASLQGIDLYIIQIGFPILNTEFMSILFPSRKRNFTHFFPFLYHANS